LLCPRFRFFSRASPRHFTPRCFLRLSKTRELHTRLNGRFMTPLGREVVVEARSQRFWVVFRWSHLCSHSTTTPFVATISSPRRTGLQTFDFFACTTPPDFPALQLHFTSPTFSDCPSAAPYLRTPCTLLFHAVPSRISAPIHKTLRALYRLRCLPPFCPFTLIPDINTVLPFSLRLFLVTQFGTPETLFFYLPPFFVRGAVFNPPPCPLPSLFFHELN